jgi:adapter protein MecA 1/2
VICLKIEKISDNQVKIMLTRLDLDKRNIKLGELAYGSEKAQELFRDIMDEAHSQCGFEAENFPLMIEAIPYSQDSITIIVTKVQSPGDLEERFKQLQHKRTNEHTEPSPREMHTPEHRPHREITNEADSPVLVFSFSTLDEAAIAASRIFVAIAGEPSLTDMLFKHSGLFYLYIELPKISQDALYGTRPVVSEFGREHTASTYSKYFLSEHGETLIACDAIRKLSVLCRY